MTVTYQPPRLTAAGSFAVVTKGRWGWGHDYFYRRFGYDYDDGFADGGGFVAGGVF